MHKVSKSTPTPTKNLGNKRKHDQSNTLTDQTISNDSYHLGGE